MPEPPPAKGGSKGKPAPPARGLGPGPGPGSPELRSAPAPPVQVPLATNGRPPPGNSEDLFEDGLQWTRILKSIPEKTNAFASEGDSSMPDPSGSPSEGTTSPAVSPALHADVPHARQTLPGQVPVSEGSGSGSEGSDPSPPPTEELEKLMMCLCEKPKMKPILKRSSTQQLADDDPILSLLGGEASETSTSRGRATSKVTIVDDQEELRAQREALRFQEAKAHEKELRMQRRSQMLVWLLTLPVRSVTYMGRCFISSPKMRQLWLFGNLVVSLFELWTSALFWAFFMDMGNSAKLEVLYLLLTADHYANAWFLMDALLSALDKIRGGEVQDMSNTGVLIMRKVDRQQQLQQKAKSLFQKLPGFCHCSTEFLLKIADVGEVLTKKKGDVLYAEHDESTSLYLILEGEVVIRDGEHVSYLSEGQTLGEFRVFELQGADDARVECIADCEIFEVQEREMKRFLENFPSDRNMLREHFKVRFSARKSQEMGGRWEGLRKATMTICQPILMFVTSGVHASRDLWLQATFAIVLLIIGNFAAGILQNRSRPDHQETTSENILLILFLSCKLMRQNLPLRYLKHFFVEQETQLYVNIRLKGSGGSTWVTLKLAVIMLGWGHWLGCVSLLVSLAGHSASGYEESVFQQFRRKSRLPPGEQDVWGDYLAAYYKAFGKNFEGSKPERVEELVLAMFICAGLLAMKSYVIGSFFKLQETKKDLDREMELLMTQADLVCIALDLPPSIRKSIRQHCMFQWSKARDVGNREVVLKTFAPDMQKKVKEQVYLPIIQANEKLLSGASSDFMLQIIDHLEVMVLQPSEILFCENDAPQELCFLETGTLMLTCQEQLVRYARSDRANEPTAVGEVSFLLKMPHLYSVRSRAGVESSVLRMSRHGFEKVMANLDEDHDQLLQNAAHSMQLTLNGLDMKRENAHDGQEDTELFQMMRESVRQTLLNRTAHMSTTFINAAAEGNVEQVELLLRKRVFVDTANSDVRSAMHLAAAEGRDHVIKILIKAEGNVNVQDRWNGTPLRDAVLGKFSAVIELLMDQNADLNLEDPATALCDAASSGNLMALQELIEVKIDPNSGDYDLRTALHLAASEGKLEVISFLLDSRADPNFKDRWGGTALEDAIQNNHAARGPEAEPGRWGGSKEAVPGGPTAKTPAPKKKKTEGAPGRCWRNEGCFLFFFFGGGV
ncbi:unnamed protein product [Effrenium voratum]|nr:unnamed protein product [Effrenium voratum]